MVSIRDREQMEKLLIVGAKEGYGFDVKERHEFEKRKLEIYKNELNLLDAKLTSNGSNKELVQRRNHVNKIVTAVTARLPIYKARIDMKNGTAEKYKKSVAIAAHKAVSTVKSGRGITQKKKIK
ncbi:MAG: hypothetical protein FWE50_00585 [Alphaproteobacteria bacterium]|nr:hypothetical protein [Alphaproteobacteria bacterium]